MCSSDEGRDNTDAEIAVAQRVSALSTAEVAEACNSKQAPLLHALHGAKMPPEKKIVGVQRRVSAKPFLRPSHPPKTGSAGTAARVSKAHTPKVIPAKYQVAWIPTINSSPIPKCTSTEASKSRGVEALDRTGKDEEPTSLGDSSQEN